MRSIAKALYGETLQRRRMASMARARRSIEQPGYRKAKYRKGKAELCTVPHWYSITLLGVPLNGKAKIIFSTKENKMFNKMILMGRLVADPELKTTPQGVTVCTFRIAVDRRFQKQGEEKKSDFFNIVAWRQTGEFVQKYFAKGRMILVEGEMNTRPYTDKNGNQATWYEVIADHVSFTGEKREDGGSASRPAQGQPPVPSAPAENPAASNDDYPF